MAKDFTQNSCREFVEVLASSAPAKSAVNLTIHEVLSVE
jgi:hypothetical protein